MTYYCRFLEKNNRSEKGNKHTFVNLFLPHIPAPNDKYGSDRADPTKWVAWAETLPPSWSLKQRNIDILT